MLRAHQWAAVVLHGILPLFGVQTQAAVTQCCQDVEAWRALEEACAECVDFANGEAGVKMDQEVIFGTMHG